MTIQKFPYKIKIMNKIKALFFFIGLIAMFSCKQKEKSQTGPIIVMKDSLSLIKDTMIFGKSTGGSEVRLFKNLCNNDSIIKVETLGEMGSSYYKFIFNEKLLKVEHIINQYEEPISLNSNPKIRNKKIESLKTSNKNELTNIFNEYKNIFNKKNKVLLSTKWIGNFSFIINENNIDWRDTYKITIITNTDSINFHAEGYQIDQNYKLLFNEDANKLYLTYEKSLDNFTSEILKTNNDFGFILFDGTNYTLECPYLDVSFHKGKKQLYILKKSNEIF